MDRDVSGMSDERISSKKSTGVAILRPEDFPQVPEIVRTSVSHKTISRANWRNRIFKDFNALDTTFEDCDFRYSVFERAYFRDSKFVNCRFDGARFVDCNFKNANFYKCDLKFVVFQRCLLEVREVLPSLPFEPNIRREALQNLRANALSTGDYASQGLLVLQEVEATKRHYSYALRGFDSYYQKKYSGIGSKLSAAVRLGWLHLGGLIWGHGEKPGRLLLSAIALLSALTFINFWSVMPRVGWVESANGLYVLEYVIRLFLSMSVTPKFQGFVTVDYLIVVIRYIYIGLFISVLYRAISHR